MQRDAVRRTKTRIYGGANVIDLAVERRAREKTPGLISARARQTGSAQDGPADALVEVGRAKARKGRARSAMGDNGPSDQPRRAPCGEAPDADLK